MPPYGEKLDFGAEEDGVVDTARVFTDSTPAVEFAERFHGSVLVVVVRNLLEWFWW